MLIVSERIICLRHLFIYLPNAIAHSLQTMYFNRRHTHISVSLPYPQSSGIYDI